MTDKVALAIEMTAEEYDFDTDEGILAGLLESLNQAMTGQTYPISTLWDFLGDESK